MLLVGKGGFRKETRELMWENVRNSTKKGYSHGQFDFEQFSTILMI